MKLKELIKIAKSQEPDYDLNLIAIADSLNIPDPYRYWFDFNEDQPKRMTSYELTSIHQTDTCVGQILFFLDDEFVALSIQESRKSTPEIKWVNEKKAGKVMAYLLSLKEQDDEMGIDILSDEDFNSDYGEGYRVTFTDNLIPKRQKYTYKGEKAEYLRDADPDNYISQKVVVMVNNEELTIDTHDLLIEYFKK